MSSSIDNYAAKMLYLQRLQTLRAAKNGNGFYQPASESLAQAWIGWRIYKQRPGFDVFGFQKWILLGGPQKVCALL